MAKKKASEIEGDLITGNYDPTLKKYRTLKTPKSDLTVVALIEQFSTSKTQLAVTTKSKYVSLRVKAKEFFKEGRVLIDIDKAQSFKRWLSESLSPVTQVQHIGLMKACWDWGIKQGLVMDNPWGEVLREIKVPPKQKPRPFTHEEIKAILRQGCFILNGSPRIPVEDARCGLKAIDNPREFRLLEIAYTH
ncbi:MAG: integrase [Cyanobacteria bacterium]|nr:integrase [Cyanobacteriota bacterium]